MRKVSFLGGWGSAWTAVRIPVFGGAAESPGYDPDRRRVRRGIVRDPVRIVNLLAENRSLPVTATQTGKDAMHIGINCHALVRPCTGVPKAIRGMVRALVEEAAEDVRFTAYVPWRFDRSLLPESPNLTLCRSWAPWGNRTLRILWEQFALPGRLVRDRVDILHAPTYVMPIWCQIPTVVNVHDCIALTHPTFCRKANASHYGRMLPKTVKRATRVVTPTGAVKRELLERMGPLRSDRVEVVPWGVDARFAPVDDPERWAEAKERYGLPDRFALHVGRNEPKKNVTQVVEAFFAATAVLKSPHSLVLCGPAGWGGARLERIIRELNISDRVIRLGFVADEDLPVLYSMAEVLVFPSLAEGFGFPVLEAMACGTPVIASDIPALREVADEAACFVTPGTLPSLREALEVMLGAPSHAQQYRQKGIRRASAFSWADHAQSILPLYRRILEETESA